MPVTPLHVLPATPVYFLFYRRMHGLAFFLATFLIDIEPILYLAFNVPQPRVPLLLGGYTPMGFHMITHNPFAVIVLVAPAMTVFAKLFELGKPFWLNIFEGTEWVNYSWKKTYLSALIGVFLHLGWDMILHRDVNFGFPFVSVPNPFISSGASMIIGIASLVLIPPSYVLGKKINKGIPFAKLP